MPRIQILPLPEGASDERPPFALVIDQAPGDGPLSQGFRDDLELTERLAERIGAQAVLVFEDTVEIPANDVSAYATPTTVVHVDRDTDSSVADQVRRGFDHIKSTYGSTA
ncbi:hypothetical protein [Streptomyces parvulus]|uniref:hypothetical protein n=1 Tax=Streptomyces parvulus TaxID=146923 RepID=UPI0033B2C37A